MPVKGWKTITVRDEVFTKLKKKAEKEHRSVTNMAEVIILEATK
jgi:predicted CopG family antitoxin